MGEEPVAARAARQFVSVVVVEDGRLGAGSLEEVVFIGPRAGARAVQLVFLLLAITFVVLAIGNFGTSSGTIQLGGYIGLATAAAAIYASFADVVNANFKRKVLPT